MIEIIMILLPLLISVESNGNPNAVGDSGQAIGILQIHPIMVKDVNRILGKEKYTLKDRYSPKKSKEMAVIYFQHYSPIALNSDKLSTVDKVVVLARQWNAGPVGHLKFSSAHHGEKIRLAFERSIRKK